MRRGDPAHHGIRRFVVSAQDTIDAAWESRSWLTPANAPKPLRQAVDQAIAGLDSGKLRVAEKSGGEWITHQWLKKAVLLSFRLEDNRAIEGGATRYYDKVPSKFGPAFDFAAAGLRVVPPAMVASSTGIRSSSVRGPSSVNTDGNGDATFGLDCRAAGASQVQVACVNGRYLLRDGYHRAVGLLAHGITHVPAFVRDFGRFGQEIVPQNMLEQAAYLGDQPPTLADYWDDHVAASVQLPASQKMILIQAVELGLMG